MLLLPFLVGAALATEPEVALGNYFADSGRLEEAARLAVEALQDHPHDLEAHLLYQRAVREGLLEAGALEKQYRLWLVAEPGDAVPRVALAALLEAENPEPGLWCQEVEGLLEPLPRDTGAQAQALRVRMETRTTCGGDGAADRQALLALAKVTPSALGLALRLRLRDGRVDEVLAEDLRTWYSHRPCRLEEPGDLWADGLKGPALKEARADALAAAQAALALDSPACAHSALRVYRQAGHDPGVGAAAKRRAELDPGWRAWEAVDAVGRVTAQAGRSRLELELEAARHAAAPETAARRLAALGDRVPPHGPLRATWLKERGFLELRLGQEAQAFDTFQEAWQENPQDRSVANAFAYTAALQGRELELALVVMDSVLNSTPLYDPWSDHRDEGYDAWAERTANQVAARMDTRAWILYQLGRKEEAATALQHALLLTRETDPIFHYHLGLVLHDLGRDDAALQQLGRGLALGPSDEEDLDARARDLAEVLFQERRWASGGLDAWVAARTPASQPSWDRAGTEFPEIPLAVDGHPRDLSAYPGVRIVVVWSTRSRAFLDLLPDLEILEQRYRRTGVHVIGIAVDEDPAAVDAFWEGWPLVPFLSAWGGPEALARLGAPDTPVVLVVGPDGTVAGCTCGAAGSVERQVTAWADALLTQAAAAGM